MGGVKITALFLMGFVTIVSAGAATKPLRRFHRLLKPKKEMMLRVQSARVILADYDLLKNDFPSLRDRSESQIDKWLLNQTAYVSKPQAAQTEVNTAISLGPESRIAYRPREYERAAVFDIPGEGLIDAKGVGSLSPHLGDHSDGLASLGEGIREYLFEKLVARVFHQSGSDFETVGTYAVIDYGFDVKYADGATAPAGEILRQGNKRFRSKFSLLDEDDTIAIEKVLRRFGLTSAGAYRNDSFRPHELLNIQGSKKKAVIDFGGFLAVDHFDRTATLIHGSRVLLDPASKDFVQPEPDLRVPMKMWGHSVSGKADPKFDNPWIWSHELAANLRSGKATRADVEQHVRNFLEPVDEIFQKWCVKRLSPVDAD